MILDLAAALLVAQLGVAPTFSGGAAPVFQVQYGAYGHPPPCGHGYDLDARDGMCYPNGMVPQQFQTGRQYPGSGGYYGGGGRDDYDEDDDDGGVAQRYPVPCGHGADLDVRDGRCYPTGTVPPQFQNRPRRDYYYRRIENCRDENGLAARVLDVGNAHVSVSTSGACGLGIGRSTASICAFRSAARSISEAASS